MPIPISQDQLVQAVRTQTFVRNGDPERIDGQTYAFRIADDLIKVDPEGDASEASWSPEEAECITLAPDEVAFVLTEEVLNLPANIKVRLKPVDELEKEGIDILGTMEFDPYFSGRILIGLHNTAKREITLPPNFKFVEAEFSDILCHDLDIEI